MGVGLEGSMGFTQYLVSHKILLLFFQNSDSEQMQIQSEKLEVQSEKNADSVRWLSVSQKVCS